MRSILLLGLLVVFFGCRPGVSALRCYSCEDCDENTQLSEMEQCDAPPGNGNTPGTPVSPSPSAPSSPAAPSPAPSAPAAPAPSPNSEEDEGEDYESGESATIGIMPAGNGAAAAAGTGTADGASEEEEYEESEEEDEERRRRRSSARQALLDMPVPVCYTVRLQLNDTVITKRGCTTARTSNESEGCEGLFDNWKVAGCTICSNEGCNQPFNVSSRNTKHEPVTLLTLMAALMAIVGQSLI